MYLAGIDEMNGHVERNRFSALVLFSFLTTEKLKTYFLPSFRLTGVGSALDRGPAADAPGRQAGGGGSGPRRGSRRRGSRAGPQVHVHDWLGV